MTPLWRAREWVIDEEGDVHETLVSRILMVLDKTFGHNYHRLVGRWYGYSMQVRCTVQGGHRFDLVGDGLPALCARCLLIMDADETLMDDEQLEILRLVRP